MKLYYTFNDVEQFIEIQEGQSTVGRSGSATYTIRNDTISKVHILLKLEDGILTVEDMDSSNGTFVNGIKIQRAEIKPDDQLKIGKIHFRIEMTEAELASARQKFPVVADPVVSSGDSSDDSITPAGGSGVVVAAEPVGKGSETFFDISQMRQGAPVVSAPAAVSPASSASGKGSLLKTVLGNRNLLLLVTGSISILLLMVVVLVSLNDTHVVGGVINGTSGTDALKKQSDYENLLKEGSRIFLEQPDVAKTKFEQATKLVQNHNATSSLIALCEVWQKGEMNWSKVSRTEFRKNLDDIRNEDEGQPKAVLYDFINEMTRLERFEQENESKFAEISILLENYKWQEATSFLNEIPKTSVFYDIADKKIKATRVRLIEKYKQSVRNARDADNAQEEVRMIRLLLTMIPENEQKDYNERLQKLRNNLDKKKTWEQGLQKLKENDLDTARQFFEMLEPTDDHYYEAQDKLAFIKEENTRQNVKILYDMQGEGKAALKVIADSMLAKFNDLGDKIKKVDALYTEALRKGEANPDDTNAHALLNQLLELEPNPDNAYYKRAQKLLADWTDVNAICARKYAAAKEKLNLKDYINARLLVKDVTTLKADYDVSEVMDVINRYVSSEINRNVRNARTLEIKRTTLEHLAKVVQIGDRDYDTVSNALLEMNRD